MARRYGLRIVEGLGSTEVLHMYLSNGIDVQKPGPAGARARLRNQAHRLGG